MNVWSQLLVSSLRYSMRLIVWVAVAVLEGCWFDSPSLHVKVSLGKILNPKLLLMCCSAPCMVATAISVCINYSKALKL